MEKRIAVLHLGKLAHYNVRKEKTGHFVARLLSYSGSNKDEPPAEIDLHKEGRHWEDQGADQDLVDDIGNAIEHQKENIQIPVYHQRGHENRNDLNNERNDRNPGGRP
ncbi:MAG: hypothetical protein ACR2KB_11490 [Chitinophagaceae bacterium]|jgi:predicted heme/steroid binding protein